ncbi:MAG: hypothetical protein QM606_01165 [Leucobacter sp.]
MSGGGSGGALLSFLRSFSAAFLRARGSGSASPSQRSTPGADAAARGPLRTAPQPASGTVPGAFSETASEDSPGRDGDGATRDLSPAEIRSLRIGYEPKPDGDPDPGEVVWTWVPYVENDGRGKDRPVLIIARIDASTTAGCYLSTKQHRGFVSVGTGGWDGQGRESFLSPERVLRVSDDGMRREGHVLSRDRFARAAEVVAGLHGIRG